jgi:hypothetical protein
MASSAMMSLALTPVTDLGRYCGLRRQQWRSKSFVAKAPSRHGGNSSAAVPVVRATGLRPRRLPEQEAVIVPVSPDDDRLDLAPGATKVLLFFCFFFFLSKTSRFLWIMKCSCQGFNTLTVEFGVLLVTAFGRCSVEHLVLGFYGLVSLNAIRMCVCVCVRL